ncbi:MAG: hypothetical protein L0211_17950 [Planctomycetaceae bacterium]|nr:hypothetical protein [Planctomycetaceae bacterium]
MRPILWVLLLPATLCGEELAPWKSNRHPTDVPKRHVQDIAAGRLEYRVVQGGTMDGRNCRSPQGVWTPFEQTWESNRSVRMENIGQTDIVNPWLVSGQSDFRSVNAIVARAVEPGMTDQEKATALWWQQVQYRFHYQGDNRELLSPVKVFNVYGHNTCGNDSICLAGLWKTAGLKVAPARLVGHCVTQVFYNGAWHLFDGDMHSLYLLRDNETIAGEQDLVRDHDLVKRTHTQGILRPQGRAGDEWESSIYVFEGKVAGDRDADRTSAMNMTLRPGEALVWRWGHTEPAKYLGSPDHKFTSRICNGLWEYRPDFTKAAWLKGADSVQGIVSGEGGLAAEEGKTGEVVWTVRSPYVFVGGKLEIEGTDASFEISWDGKTWEKAGTDLDPFFPSAGPARYAYHLRCRLAGPARLRRLRIASDVQMAPLSLPEMGVGENQFTYSDETPSERNVRITHEWVERSASTPPAAPVAAVRPRDRGEAEGTSVVFEWEPALDPDGNKIADYHFELSSRADMKWPLSMSFAKLISRTSDAGSARFTLKAPGELNPDREHYWHVRAKDDQGVWGNWSKTWRFTPRGPSPPMEVALVYDSDKNQGVLHWKPNPLGRKPVAYRVYASDEKGFSASDEPFTVAGGLYDFHRKVSTKTPTQFPANFLAETSATELAALGEGVALAGANKAYYRVVAVDEKGNRSGPSDYAAAPRPVIYTRPMVEAKPGVEYRYDVGATRSLGDLRTRVLDGRETMNYWDVEQPQFQIEKGPEWLSIDKSTGRLFGQPDRAGRFEVIVAVTLEREQRTLDEGQLRWGVEKVVDSRVETVGIAKQAFVIEARP